MAGAAAAWRAAERLDPRCRNPWPFLARRAQGGMLDWLRDADWVKRRGRACGDRRQMVAAADLAVPDFGDPISRAGTRDDGPASVARREGWDRLLAGFTREERLVLTLYYGEGLTMKTAAGAIGISESRVSQMHSSIVARLKAMPPDRVRDLLTNGPSTEAP